MAGRRRSKKPSRSPARKTAQVIGADSTRDGQSKLDKMKTRAVMAFAMIFGFLFVIYMGHLYVCLFVAVLQTMIFNELLLARYASAKRKGEEQQHFRLVNWIWFIIAMLYSYGSSWLKAPMGFFDYAKFARNFLTSRGIVDELAFLQAVAFSMAALHFVFTVLSFKKNLYSKQFSQLTWTALTLIMVVGQLKFTIYMIYEGMFWFLFPASLVVANDTFAYFSGVAFGRRFFKDTPFLSISPNKTWEGFLGAGILTCVYAYYFASIWGSVDALRCSYEELRLGATRCRADVLFYPDGGPSEFKITIQQHAVFMALFASTIAPFGGFFASAIKRAAKIKDFDSVIPGHGGITDRMDCQMLMMLFAYVYYSTFVRHLHIYLPLAQIKGAISQLDYDDLQAISAYVSRKLAQRAVNV